jgi:hypothetical protein
LLRKVADEAKRLRTVPFRIAAPDGVTPHLAARNDEDAGANLADCQLSIPPQSAGLPTLALRIDAELPISTDRHQVIGRERCNTATRK